MSKRIFRSIFLVAICVLIACFAIIMCVLYENFAAVQEERLQTLCEYAAKGVEESGAEFFSGLKTGSSRVTWIDKDGKVLYDSDADASSMGNHADRSEVEQAMQDGSGSSVRYSSTLSENTLYYARRITNGTVVRVAATQASVFGMLTGMLMPALIVLAVAVALSVVLANRLSRRIVEPLNKLDIDEPLKNDTYDEVAPLLARIERQHRQIESQVTQIQRRHDEFAAITGGMSEGLILLNEKGAVLSMNRTAMRLFGADEDCTGRDILTIDRSAHMRKCVGEAMDGKRAEAVMELAGGEYQVDFNPVVSEGKTAGVAILAIDITQKAHAEQLRREFSANVSHELKTPLQSIMGSAELLESGLVKQEDIPRFIDRIRTESARLVTLIDDIIRLSQLDEGEEIENERTDLLEMAQEASRSLEEAALKNDIKVSVSGENAEICGARRLIYEIVYNLLDNAIKYNVKGGSAEVKVSQKDGSAVVEVADTGIGIPREHANRVFERFYRVDKSHSRQTGGTGLGLSIVKHAAQYLGAQISMQSEPGKGTTVRVVFPAAMK